MYKTMEVKDMHQDSFLWGAGQGNEAGEGYKGGFSNICHILGNNGNYKTKNLKQKVKILNFISN